MASPARLVLEEKGEGDEAEQRLLEGNEVVIVPAREEASLVSAKSSKKG